MVPLLPAVKDALSARYTHEMLVNASTAELALMIFGTKSEFFVRERKSFSSLSSSFVSSFTSSTSSLLSRRLLVFLFRLPLPLLPLPLPLSLPAPVPSSSSLSLVSSSSLPLFSPLYRSRRPLFQKNKKQTATSNFFHDEEPENFRHIVAPRGVGGENGRPLMEWVTPESVFLPLEELVALALAENAERLRRRGAPPPRANPLDVVLVAYRILLKALGGANEDEEDAEVAAAAPCSKTVTVVVAGEDEEAYERGKGEGGLAEQTALLLQGIGCKLRVLLVDPSPTLRVRGGVSGGEAEANVSAAANKENGGDGRDSDGGSDESDGDDEPSPPQQLRLPAALEALVDFLPAGQGLVRIQRVSGAVGLSAAITEAPPPATTYWKGALELSPRAAAPELRSAALASPPDGGGAPHLDPLPTSPPPPSESCIPIKISRCVTSPETPKWVRMTGKPGEEGSVRLRQETEYRRRSRSAEAQPGGGGGLRGEEEEEEEGGQQQQPPRKVTKADDAGAHLAAAFEAGLEENADGSGDGDGAAAGEGMDIDKAVEGRGPLDDKDNDNDEKGTAVRRNSTTRSLSLEPVVPKAERGSCYRYGQEQVVVNARDDESCRLPKETLRRSMVLLGFASPSPLHAIEQGAWVMTAGGGAPAGKTRKAAGGGGGGAAAAAAATAAGSRAAEALSALARAAQKNNKVMVVRWVSREGGNPRLYAGFPVLGEEVGEGGEGEAEEKKPDLDGDFGDGGKRSPVFLRPRLSSPDCFVLVSLPFADDVRRVRFPALDADPARMPSGQQVAAARELVRSWNLRGRGSGLFARARVDGSEGRLPRRKGGGEEDVVVGGAHPNPSRLRQLACAAGRAVALIRAGEGGGAAATTGCAVPEVGKGPATGLLEPPAWPEGSRADAAARGLAEAFASVL